MSAPLEPDPDDNEPSDEMEPHPPQRGRRRVAALNKDKPTIRVVAERAQVAVSTVSRVLNGGYASAAAKGRVQLAIQELGYAPSITAQSLVTGRAGCIGVISYTTQTAWFSQILAGIEEQLADSRQSVLLASLMLNGRYDSNRVAAWIAERRVDGLMFIRYTRREHVLFTAASTAGLPVVLIGPDIKAPASSIVRCNNLDAGRIVAEHLIERGHRRIAFAGGPRDSIDTRDRHRGLSQALAQREIELPEKRVWFGPNYGPESGAEYAQLFLALPARARPSAVVLGNDAMALGFMRTVLQQGVKIPEEVSVVGFDGIPEGGHYWPGLTTILQPAHRMGASGCRALLECIANPDLERTADVQYGVELVIRESTGEARSLK
ncbi:MAG TPA: LacI family DNA-binding transcriptional regulator [Polyangiaceae bacterium]|nr:LacI family DNA-binding transcriptional regulator [Polyangiaceae bacterium]